jgi:two-component system, sensor histidine kinase
VGSVFTVTLACRRPSAPIEATPSPDPPGIQRRCKVLVAEDHPINLKYMSILLEKMGHEAVFCENGQEALQLLARNPSTWCCWTTTCRCSTAWPPPRRSASSMARAEIKVILVTADVVNDTRKRALEVGVNEFTSKPLQADDLQARPAPLRFAGAPVRSRCRPTKYRPGCPT